MSSDVLSIAVQFKSDQALASAERFERALNRIQQFDTKGLEAAIAKIGGALNKLGGIKISPQALEFIDKISQLGAATAALQNLDSLKAKMDAATESTSKFGGSLFETIYTLQTVSSILTQAAAGWKTFFLSTSMAADGAASLEVQFQSTFADAAGSADAKLTELMGTLDRTTGSVQELMISSGRMVSNFDIVGENAVQAAGDIAHLSSALANYQNVDVGTAQNAINMALAGQTRGLRQLGIMMTETDIKNRMFADSINGVVYASEEEAKCMATLALLQEKGSSAVAAFTDKNNRFSEQMKQLTDNFGELSEVIGAVFLPLITSIVKEINSVIKGFNDLGKTPFGSFIQSSIIVTGTFIGLLTTAALTLRMLIPVYRMLTASKGAATAATAAETLSVRANTAAYERNAAARLQAAKAGGGKVGAVLGVAAFATTAYAMSPTGSSKPVELDQNGFDHSVDKFDQAVNKQSSWNIGSILSGSTLTTALIASLIPKSVYGAVWGGAKTVGSAVLPTAGTAGRMVAGTPTAAATGGAFAAAGLGLWGGVESLLGNGSDLFVTGKNDHFGRSYNPLGESIDMLYGIRDEDAPSALKDFFHWWSGTTNTLKTIAEENAESEKRRIAQSKQMSGALAKYELETYEEKLKNLKSVSDFLTDVDIKRGKEIQNQEEDDFIKKATPRQVQAYFDKKIGKLEKRHENDLDVNDKFRQSDERIKMLTKSPAQKEADERAKAQIQAEKDNFVNSDITKKIQKQKGGAEWYANRILEFNSQIAKFDKNSKENGDLIKKEHDKIKALGNIRTKEQIQETVENLRKEEEKEKEYWKEKNESFKSLLEAYESGMDSWSESVMSSADLKSKYQNKYDSAVLSSQKETDPIKQRQALNDAMEAGKKLASMPQGIAMPHEPLVTSTASSALTADSTDAKSMMARVWDTSGNEQIQFEEETARNTRRMISELESINATIGTTGKWFAQNNESNGKSKTTDNPIVAFSNKMSAFLDNVQYLNNNSENASRLNPIAEFYEAMLGIKTEQINETQHAEVAAKDNKAEKENNRQMASTLRLMLDELRDMNKKSIQGNNYSSMTVAMV